jgi:DNA repair exonuclease SbcCD ATPase subunit
MPTPSWPELDRFEREVNAAREQLARLEQEHADLVIELSEFEALYNARVSPLQAKLEETRLHIDEYQLRIELLQWRGNSLSPSQLEAEVEYRLRERRQHVHETYEQAERAQPPPPPIDRAAELDLKQVYRELAKRSHPDLAVDEADRTARAGRMKDINASYARRDVTALRAWLRQLDSKELRQRESPEQMWSRLKIEYDRIEAAIKRVKTEMAALNRSPLMSLKIDVAIARARGQDVLGEVAAQVQTQLIDAERELAQLIERFRETVEAAGLSG